MAMKFEEIVSLFEDAGYEPRSYSGRAMYGAKCLAVHVDRESGAEVVAKVLEQALAQADADHDDYAGLAGAVGNLGELCGELRDAREDSMGRGGVVYWPGLEWQGEEEADDDDE